MSLPYMRVIRGHYHVKGFKPDGDSVRFTADTPALFNGLYRDHKNTSTVGEVQLRLEGIDAPETHYANEAQPNGDTARDRLLSLLGFSDLRFEGQKIMAVAQERTRGTILTKGFDLHGRPVSYVLVGERPELPDGGDVRVQPELLAQTVNTRMLMDGHAYPLFYTSMPALHRNYLRRHAAAAREKRAGVWGSDSSRTFQLVDRSSVCIPSGSLIYPKFFRRCLDYLFEIQSGFTGDLTAWLVANERRNDLVVLDKQELPLSRLFEHKGPTVTCQTDLLDMLFIEK